MSNSFTRPWASGFLALAALAFTSALPAQAAGESQCQCRAELDPCLIGEWLVPSHSLHPHWQQTAAHHLGLKVNRTAGHIQLYIRKDRLFLANIDFDSWSRAQAGLNLASQVNGSTVGRVCVAQDGKLCTYGLRGDITVSNQINLAGKSVDAPGMKVPAADKKQQSHPYSCTDEDLELTFINLGKKQRIKAKRR